VKRITLIWLTCGAIYISMEMAWRGFSHPSMFIVGGLCGVLVGEVNQLPIFYRRPVIVQSVIGAVIVLTLEFISGCIVNIWLRLNVWDYSGVFGNVYGQICLPAGLLWLALMPFAIWVEDTARWLIYSWDKLLHRAATPPDIPPYTLKSVYKDFFTGK